MIRPIYAGIGARDTPDHILPSMVAVASILSSFATLRSGGAPGADTAFEKGCDLKSGTKEIYLPWETFNKSTSTLFGSTLESRNHAKQFIHKSHWMNLGDRGRDFMARNSYQVLGQDLKTPADFIICWTKGGNVVGGTGQALRLAAHYRIPIFNLGIMSHLEASDRISEILNL